jgi:hypothetical protein
MRPLGALGWRSVNPRLIDFVSACVKGASKRYAKAGMDIPLNCEGKCANGWNRSVSELLIRQATRSKRNWSSVLAFK